GRGIRPCPRHPPRQGRFVRHTSTVSTVPAPSGRQFVERSVLASRSVRVRRHIYDHPDNAAFRLKRPDPNRIYPGDVLMIPGGDSPSSPSPPPLVPKPVRLQRQDAELAITNYLKREMRRDRVSVVVDHSANLIVFGEKHHTFDAFKAFFLCELIRPV